MGKSFRIDNGDDIGKWSSEMLYNVGAKLI